MTPSLQLVSVQLRVADLARAVDFYTRQVGFVIAESTATRADLAVAPGEPTILTLLSAPGAKAPARDAAGLFHAALLLPSRAALGAWLKHAVEREVEFGGFSDHGVSEALYFNDPEGNGLEFYADRPRADWPFAANGELAMTTRQLDLHALLAAASPPSAGPLAGARWGHLHLRVTNLARSDAYYRERLGMVVTQGSYPGARFLAADGYHHHLGLNTWGHPRTPQIAESLGLAEAAFARAGVATEQRLVDPDGMGLRIVPVDG